MLHCGDGRAILIQGTRRRVPPTMPTRHVFQRETHKSKEGRSTFGNNENEHPFPASLASRLVRSDGNGGGGVGSSVDRHSLFLSLMVAVVAGFSFSLLLLLVLLLLHLLPLPLLGLSQPRSHQDKMSNTPLRPHGALSMPSFSRQRGLLRGGFWAAPLKLRLPCLHTFHASFLPPSLLTARQPSYLSVGRSICSFYLGL